jgi:hypothetical protein
MGHRHMTEARLIIGPQRLLEARLYRPVELPDGFVYYRIRMESGRYFALAMPLIRDANNKPITLSEEPAASSVVRLALDAAGFVAAVQIIVACWVDPFAPFTDGRSALPASCEVVSQGTTVF